ncbi:MAG TPA: aminomethyl-transferring glycine dehydrogenase subunit GcvPA [Anaerolineales bacterium]|nr:aminomethyl-transferring glycine dehydrogenase subunit GcvPA [Anaerolineales bacterium]
MQKPIVYPYIPNSVPEIKAQMMKDVGVESIDEFYSNIPNELRLNRRLNLPEPFLSEYALRRHVESILSRNQHTGKFLSFLGAGCWPHYVPAVCDEINSRSEFLTAYAGEPYDDHGRFQSLFEYASMMGELLDLDVVSIPTYDWMQAAATSIRMACRITGRQIALVSNCVSKDKFSKFLDYCAPDIQIETVDFNFHTGQLDLNDLRNKISRNTACIYFENPSYLGIIEQQGNQISDIAHTVDALVLVGVDPISLGVLTPPVNYGADLVSGDLQPLGMHQNYGGGQAGFIASRDDVRFVMEFPTRLFGITHTSVPGEYGFGDVAYERTSFARREEGNEWVGTAAALWGITAGVYLALMGPQGMQELGEGIMQRSIYASKRIGQIPGVRSPALGDIFFKEFVVNFNQTGKSVEEINKRLLEHGIFGGKDLSFEFPDLGQSALFCITEMHTQKDIDTLVSALEDVVQ